MGLHQQSLVVGFLLSENVAIHHLYLRNEGMMEFFFNLFPLFLVNVYFSEGFSLGLGALVCRD